MATRPTCPVTLGERTVEVAADGLYARHRMDTPLAEVARDPRVPGVDFFRGLRKNRMDSRIGETLSPNFYYAASSARLTLTAPTRRLRERLPRELAPLEVLPGLGLVSVMVFRYEVADIDPYLEAAVGIAVRPARHGAVGAVDLASALAGDHLHSVVLALPVTTEIAQVRGHDGYGFPKWVTDMDITIDRDRLHARIDGEDGRPDLSLTAVTPRQRASRSGRHVSTLTSYTRIDGDWHATVNQTNVLATGGRMLPRDAELTLGHGRLSEDLRSVSPGRALRLDVTTSAQMALHMPVPTSIDTAARR